MSNVVPLRPVKASAEAEAAWHVYAALVQYQARIPALADDPFYQETSQEAYAHFAALFMAHHK